MSMPAMLLREESFGIRNKFGPSVLSKHRYREVVRWEIPAFNGCPDLEALPTSDFRFDSDPHFSVVSPPPFLVLASLTWIQHH